MNTINNLSNWIYLAAILLYGLATYQFADGNVFFGAAAFGFAVMTTACAAKYREKDTGKEKK